MDIRNNQQMSVILIILVKASCFFFASAQAETQRDKTIILSFQYRTQSFLRSFFLNKSDGYHTAKKPNTAQLFSRDNPCLTRADTRTFRKAY